MSSIIEEAVWSLVKHGFIVKTVISCFDVVARKNNTLLLIKVVEDANSITKEAAEQFSRTAAALHATPHFSRTPP